MSHFTVLVKIDKDKLEKATAQAFAEAQALIAKHPAGAPDVTDDRLEAASRRRAVDIVVAGMMAPYQENNMGDCPPEFMEFNDQEPEYREEWDKNEETIPVFVKERSVIFRYSEAGVAISSPIEKKVRKELDFNTFSISAEDRKKYDAALAAAYTADGISEKMVRPQELFSDFDNYVKRWHETERDENGMFGYLENPNATWDWYQVGGRWAGMLRTHVAATTGSRGEKSLLMKGDPYEDKELEEHGQLVDIAMIKDVDWGFFDRKALKQAKESYARLGPVFDRILAGENIDDILSAKRAEAPPLASKETKEDEEARKEGWFWSMDIHSILWDLQLIDREAQKKARVAAAGRADHECRTTIIFEDRIPKNEAEFLKKYIWYWEFSTYAVVEKDGKWIAKGEMGWFASSSETPDEGEQWGRSFNDGFVRDEDPETTLVIIDCHI